MWKQYQENSYIILIMKSHKELYCIIDPFCGIKQLIELMLTLGPSQYKDGVLPV